MSQYNIPSCDKQRRFLGVARVAMPPWELWPPCAPPDETGCKVAGLHNSCIHSVTSHSWCQITPFTQSCIRSSEILAPSPPNETTAARNAPARYSTIQHHGCVLAVTLTTIYLLQFNCCTYPGISGLSCMQVLASWWYSGLSYRELSWDRTPDLDLQSQTTSQYTRSYCCHNSITDVLQPSTIFTVL